MSSKKQFLSILLLFIIYSTLSAQLVQWRGPDRKGHYPEEGLLQEWPKRGPGLVVKFENLNNGYSSPVYYKEIIYITGKKDTLTVMTAMKLDGTLLWETPYGRAWERSFPETRNTPTIENDRIYISAGMGTVNCIDANTGKVIWSVNTHKKFGGKFHNWGYAESLLATENAVISSPVGERTIMVALDKNTGELIWETESLGDVRSYVSPKLIDHNGRKMILAVTTKFAIGVDPENGTLLWRYDLADNHQGGRNINTNTPIYHESDIFITRGYDSEAVMLTLSENGSSVSLKWTSDVLDTHHGGVVLVDGYLYGSNWINNGMGNWVCLDWDTGEVMYEESWHNKGSIIYADNRLYVYDEKQGNIGLVEPDPSGFKLKGSFRMTDGIGPHWAHPAIFDKKLFVRHGDVLCVYDLAVEN